MAPRTITSGPPCRMMGTAVMMANARIRARTSLPVRSLTSPLSKMFPSQYTLSSYSSLMASSRSFVRKSNRVASVPLL